MKKLSRFLIPLLVLSVVLCCFVAITSAEDAASTPAYRVTPIKEDGTLNTAEAETYTDKDFTAFAVDHGTPGSNNVYTVSNLQVDLLSDVAWTEMYSIQTEGKFILNLNGFTLTMNGWKSDSQLGRFQLAGTSANHADTVFTVNGRADDGEVNGSIVTAKTRQRIVIKYGGNQYMTVNFNNVDFRSTTKSDFSFFELQSSHTYFNNCNFYDTGFSMSTGGFSYHSRVEFDGCTINSGNHGAVFQLGKSSDGRTPTTVVFKNGTVNSTAKYLVNVKTEASYSGSNVIADSNGDNRSEGVKARSITITDSLINMPTSNLANCLNNAVTTTITLGLNTRVVFAADPMNTDKIVVAIPDGFVMARYSNKDGGSFMVVAPENAVTVNFYETAGGEPITCIMLKGINPSIYIPGENYIEQDANNKYTLKRFGGWKDAEGNLVTTLTGDVKLYRAAEDVAYYATFSSTTPSVESLVEYSFDDNNIYGKMVSPAVLVQLYQDCVHTAQNNDIIQMTGAMTIDLNGNTLTHGKTATGTDFALRPYNNSDDQKRYPLTVMNGTVNLDKSRFVYTSGQYSGNVTFTDVTFYMTGYTPLMETRSTKAHGHIFTLTNVTVYVNNGGKNASADIFALDRAGKDISSSTKYVFDNFKLLTQDGTPVKYVFKDHSTSLNRQITFTLKNSTIDIPLTSDGAIFKFHNQETTSITITNTDINTYGNGNLIEKADPTGSYTTEITVSDLDLDNSALWTKSLFPQATTFTVNGAVGAPIVVYGGNASMPYTVARDSQIATVIWNIRGETYECKYIEGITPDFYGVAIEEDGKNAYVTDPAWIKTYVATTVAGQDPVTYTPDLVSAGYVITNGDGNVRSFSRDNVIDERVFFLGDGETLTFYKNIVFATATSGNLDMKFRVGTHTLDLNTWSLDLTGSSFVYYRFVLTNDVTFNVKNGTIVSDYNVFYSQESSVANLNKLTVQVTAAQPAIDYRKGELNATDCTIFNAEGGNLINIGNRGATVNMTFTACHLTAGAEVFRHSPVDANQKGNYTVTFNGGSITARDGIFCINKDRTSNKDNVLNMSFGGGIKINVASGVYFDLVSFDITDTFTFTDCWLNAKPDSYTGNVAPNVITASLRTTNDSVYGYRVTSHKLPVWADLTLFSNFNLNLYVPAEITAVSANGQLLTLNKMEDGTYRAVVSAISAASAAEKITFRLTYIEDGIEITATKDYSVLDYAQTLLAGDYSAESKQLVASAVRYIAAAYVYGNSENVDLANFIADNENYKSAIAEAESLPNLDELTSDTVSDGLDLAIRSAQLALSGDLKYRLNLQSTFSGTLTVNGVRYTVTNGLVNGNAFIDITLRGSDYLAGLTITASNDSSTVSGSYDLAAYIANMKGTKGDEFDTLLRALYAYVTEARDYSAFVEANGGNKN